jgi:hypothetical protein
MQRCVFGQTLPDVSIDSKASIFKVKDVGPNTIRNVDKYSPDNTASATRNIQIFNIQSNSKQQRFIWQADGSSASQNFAAFYGFPQSFTVSILSHINTVQTAALYISPF